MVDFLYLVCSFAWFIFTSWLFFGLFIPKVGRAFIKLYEKMRIIK